MLTILISMASFSQLAVAQNTWGPIPCTDSALLHPPLQCQSNSAVRSAASGIQAVSTLYAITGWAGPYYANMMLQWPTGATYITTYTNADVIRFMKTFNNQTRDGENWGELRSFGDTSYMTFKSKALSCVSFDQPGPYKTIGYAWTLRGYACRSTAIDKPDDFVKMLLAKTKIGK